MTGTNDVPQAAPDTAEVTENGAITIAALNGALANDTDIDVDGTALTVSGIRTGATTETGVSGAIGSGLTGTYGTLTLAADGSYTYAADQAQVDTLAEGASGVDVFTYTTSDGDLTDTAEIRITVTGTNDQADYFGATSASISAGTGSTIQTGVILGFDVDSNPGLSSTPVVAGAEGHGLFYIVHAGTTALNTRIGTASENPSDPLANLPQQQVFSNVSVLPGNDQSYSIDFFYNTTDQDPDLPGLGLRVHYNSALISEVVLTPINTGLLGVSDQADTLDFDNDPTTDRFVLVGWADISNQNWPSFTNAPIFNLSFEANMPADSVTTTSINLSGEPVEGYELSAYSVHLVNGPFVAEFNNQGYLSSDQWVYVPNDGVLEALGDGEQLIDNYQFTASDGSRQSVTVTLLGANDAPEFTGDATAQIRPGETYALEFDDLAVGDPDTPAEALTFTVLDSVGGSLAVDGQPSTTFTLAEISAGQVTFTDAVSDETAPSFTFVVEDTNEDDSSPTQHTFDFEMQPNTAPVFNQDDPIATSSGQVLLITVATLLANDIDVEGDPITVLEVNSLSLQGGTVSYDGVTISYEAPDKFSGDDQIFYTISDGFGGETQASLEISVGIAQDKLSPSATATVLDPVDGDPELKGPENLPPKAAGFVFQVIDSDDIDRTAPVQGDFFTAIHQSLASPIAPDLPQPSGAAVERAAQLGLVFSPALQAPSAPVLTNTIAFSKLLGFGALLSAQAIEALGQTAPQSTISTAHDLNGHSVPTLTQVHTMKLPDGYETRAVSPPPTLAAATEYDAPPPLLTDRYGAKIDHPGNANLGPSDNHSGQLEGPQAIVPRLTERYEPDLQKPLPQASAPSLSRDNHSEDMLSQHELDNDLANTRETAFSINPLAEYETSLSPLDQIGDTTVYDLLTEALVNFDRIDHLGAGLEVEVSLSDAPSLAGVDVNDLLNHNEAAMEGLLAFWQNASAMPDEAGLDHHLPQEAQLSLFAERAQDETLYGDAVPESDYDEAFTIHPTPQILQDLLALTNPLDSF